MATPLAKSIKSAKPVIIFLIFMLSSLKNLYSLRVVIVTLGSFQWRNSSLYLLNGADFCVYDTLAIGTYFNSHLGFINAR